MYGLVNNAIRSMVLEQMGEETWTKIRSHAGVEIDEFRALESYDDGITYGLVQSASEILGVPGSDLLHAFGRHWILYTGSRGYGDLMDLSGSDLPEFLDNLDALHTQVTMSFPELRPPSFEREVRSDGSILLKYYSEREGLAPMVEGLIEGLGERFDQPVNVRQVNRKSECGFDGFEIRNADQVELPSDAA